jgi:hypothetical protein
MGRMGHAGDDVVIRLSHDEAPVLFELLHHWESQHRVTQPEHHAGQVALWNLSCLLERGLVELFDPAYDRLITEAANPAGRRARKPVMTTLRAA